MKFDINQKAFPSATHKSIWHVAVFMAPFYEVIPPKLSEKNSLDLCEGEKSLYNFMVELYSNMYDRPEEFYIPVGEYDSYINSKDKRNFTDKDKKRESNLRNNFQKAIQYYQKLLYEIGTKARLDSSSYNLLADKSVLNNVIINHNLRIVRKDQDKRISALSNLGINIDYSRDNIIISSDKYPKMLMALSALCKSDNKKYVLTNFLRCDFRGLINSYRPGLDDAVAILPDDLKKNVLGMDDFMKEIKSTVSVEPLKNTTLFSEWKVFYKLKGKAIYSFHSDTDGLKTFAYFSHYGNISRLGYFLKEEADSLYTWFFDRVPTSICSCKNNKLVDIGGREKRICGLMNRVDVINPNDNNLGNLKYIIKLYLDKVYKQPFASVNY